MKDDVPLYRRDPEAWHAYLAEGNAKQPRKRVSADLIIRNRDGLLLLVKPQYKPDWDLPGGMVEANEPPADAAQRELREELDLEVSVGQLLCVDWVSPHDPWDDLLAFIFDAGVIAESAIRGIRTDGAELSAFDFFDLDHARRLLRPYIWRRALAALTALDTSRPKYLQDGYERPAQ